ncbi:MAG TPA: RNA polymerase sigma factor [Methylomirabilota bacterium]|jgi:RNA polymerase sigma-70 factor (ECF subfamily)|nr:RNA polymerase sigma factor [Methylomirabilota bacterium]
MGLASFDEVVAAHHPEIYRYLRRLTWRASGADDLVQETFLRAYRAWPTLSADANVRAWLFAIATNLARNHFRSEARRRRAYVAAGEGSAGSEPAGPEEEHVLRETRELLDRVVAALPLKQRLAFTLRKVHDLEYDAIAESLECSPDSARAHVFQALKKIRVSLNGHALPMERTR